MVHLPISISGRSRKQCRIPSLPDLWCRASSAESRTRPYRHFCSTTATSTEVIITSCTRRLSNCHFCPQKHRSITKARKLERINHSQEVYFVFECLDVAFWQTVFRRVVENYNCGVPGVGNKRTHYGETLAAHGTVHCEPDRGVSVPLSQTVPEWASSRTEGFY